jgi:hypothetical protein
MEGIETSTYTGVLMSIYNPGVVMDNYAAFVENAKRSDVLHEVKLCWGEHTRFCTFDELREFMTGEKD